MIEMISSLEYAAKLGISAERVRQLCKAGRVIGAKQFVIGSSSFWMIPKNAKDPRGKNGRPLKNTIEAVKIVQNKVSHYVLDLAKKSGVAFIKSPNDALANVITHLSDDDVICDETEDLIVALRRANVINGTEMVSLLGQYIKEQESV